MSLADIVIPQGVENEVAMQLIIQHVKRELDRYVNTVANSVKAAIWARYYGDYNYCDDCFQI